MKYKIGISRKYDRIGVQVYLHGVRGNDYHRLTFDKGEIVWDKKPHVLFEEAERTWLVDDDFLQAFADGLGEFGIYPQKTNKDKIKAEAISDERKEQIEYLRGLNKEIIFKKLTMTKNIIENEE